MVLLALDVNFVKVPLVVNSNGDICEDVKLVDWVGGDTDPVRCVCEFCHHVFFEGYPETLNEFENSCKEHKESK